MAIKVTEKQASVELKTFPKLMASEGGNIWLMQSPTRGTLVKPSTSYREDRPSGFHSEGLDASEMQDYNEPLTLENL